MLERIINITAGSDYKQSARPSSRQTNAYRQYNNFNVSSNDSVLLSPATAFLSSIHWRLKKVVSENEKILIAFSFDGFEFSSAFYIAELTQNHKIDYDIRYQIESFVGISEINCKISTPMIHKNDDQLQVRETLAGLKDFMKSIYKNDADPNINWADNLEVQQTFTELEYPLSAEFDYINNCLINFLEKYLSIKLNIKNENGNARDTLALKFLQLKKN